MLLGVPRFLPIRLDLDSALAIAGESPEPTYRGLALAGELLLPVVRAVLGFLQDVLLVFFDAGLAFFFV
jgi:hypothetical protein